MATNSLSPKQQRFVQEYLVDQNGTKAAVRAGYSEHTAQEQSSRLLSNVMVKAEVEKGLEVQKRDADLRAKQKGITVERWLDEVAAMGFSDITDAFSPDGKGQLTMSLADIKARGLGRLIRKMKVLPNGKIEFEMHSKLPALELLAKHHGWIKDQLEHSGVIGNASLNAQDLKDVNQDPVSRKLARQLALRQAAIKSSNPEGE